MPPLIRPEDESSKADRIEAIADAERSAEERLVAAERKRAIEFIEQHRPYFDGILQELVASYRANYTGKGTIGRAQRESVQGQFTFFMQNRRYYDDKYRLEELAWRRYCDANNYLYSQAISDILSEEVARLTDDNPSRVIVSAGYKCRSWYTPGEDNSSNPPDQFTNTFTLTYIH